MLDWTYNPLVAMFMACRSVHPDEGKVDGCVYALNVKDRRIRLVPEYVGRSPDSMEMQFKCQPASADAAPKITNGENIDEIFTYVPRAISPRMLNQRAVVTIHFPPEKEVDADACIVIPQRMKFEMLRHLDVYGINDAMLFPDLDGLSSYVDFKTMVYKLLNGESEK